MERAFRFRGRMAQLQTSEDGQTNQPVKYVKSFKTNPSYLDNSKEEQLLDNNILSRQGESLESNGTSENDIHDNDLKRAIEIVSKTSNINGSNQPEPIKEIDYQKIGGGSRKQYSNDVDETTRKSISSNRITVLDEPTTIINTTKSMLTNGRKETSILSRSQLGGVVPPWIEPSGSNSGAEGNSLLETSNESTILIILGPIIVFLFGFIVYNLFSRKCIKKNIKNLPNSLIPPSYRNKQSLRRESSNLIEGHEIGIMSQNSRGCAGECVQLVDRNCNISLPKRRQAGVNNKSDLNGQEIVLELTPTDRALIGRQCDERETSSIVILGRKMAKNSLVMAAKSSAKPRVKLFTTRLRKFIDDEAEELQQREAKGGQISFKDRIIGRILASLYSNKTSDTSEQEQLEEEVGSHIEQNQQIVVETGVPLTIGAEVHRSSEIESINSEVGGKNMQANYKISSSSSCKADESNIQAPQKLSPSPIVHEACSSLSGCSFFSSSPIGQPVSSCGCDLNDRDRLVASVQSSNLRSRSQGHSPSRLSQAGQIYRPCCSASPSNLCGTHPRNEHTRKAYCNHQLMDLKPNLTVPLLDTARTCHHLDPLVCTRSQPTSTLPPLLTKCSSSHMKRQYENYYDDERDDAYRRLTASIGMEFGIDFDTENQMGANTMDTFHYSTQPESCNQVKQSIFRYNGCQQACNNPGSDDVYDSRPMVNSFIQADNRHLQEPYCKSCHREIPGNVNQITSGTLLRNPYLQNSGGDDASLADGRGIYGGLGNMVNNNYSASSYDTNFVGQKPCKPGLVPKPLTSILVQQPSVSTPSPTGDNVANSSSIEVKDSTRQGEQMTIGAMSQPSTTDVSKQEDFCNPQSESKVSHRRSSSSFTRSTNRCKLKCGRRLSQNHANIRNGTIHNPLCPRALRRLSVASNQSVLQQPQSRIHGVSALEHRASIASDGSHWVQQQQQSLYNQMIRGNFARTNPMQDYHNIPRSHQPSDASLYESQYCSMTQNGKSNCSSSGGSSSGIGVSGSACTNTPTGIFPFGGFPTCRGEPLQDFACSSSYQHQQFNPYVFSQHGTGAHVTPMNSACRSPICQTRKFSLPVQLESQSTERISPSIRNRLLFEKNLQPVDSSTSILQQRITDSGIVSSLGQSPNQPGYRPSTESRRSSQTITRQSSFWLEDNSVDSILSLTTSGFVGQASQDGSQIDVNQLPSSEQDCNFGLSSEPMQQQAPQTSSQRPSITSAILSGDSIDSVKQQPPTRNAKDTAQQSDIGYNDANNDEDTSKVATSGDSSFRDKYKSNFRASLKNRLSSSSTSSTASSPSPDFSRPSKRILALASKSSGISKRHLFGRLRSRRYPRMSVSQGSSSSSGDSRPSTHTTKHQNSAPASIPYKIHKDESEEDTKDSTSILSREQSHSEEQEQEVDGVFMSPPNERPISDHNSASLERQCRDLWKLRATLHDNSEISDNWSNYHQRLNRRYDSGYKSIENQLSSSVEGNILVAASNLHGSQRTPSPSTTLIPQETIDESSSLLTPRPQSGCSGYVFKKSKEEKASYTSNSSPVDVQGETQRETILLDDELVSSRSPVEIIESKLIDLDLEEVALDCLFDHPLDRECNSRSSNEEENKNKEQT